jgi:hypothetical protein
MESSNVIKLETRYHKLERLVKWERIEEVNDMLLNNISPHRVEDFCKENGFNISHPKLYEYRELLKEALVKRITVERLLGIGVPKRSPILIQALTQGSKELVKNEIQVLDAIIQRGFDALTSNPSIKLVDALRAIELKNKITGGNHSGLTAYGLDHIRELEQAKFQAIVGIVIQYLPEDKVEELQLAIEQAERKFYEDKAPDLLQEYEKAKQDELNNVEEEEVEEDE